MTISPAEAMVENYCRELRLPGLRKTFRTIARDALATGQDYPAFLAACLEQELQVRRENRLKSRLGQARFPVIKTLDTFDFTCLPQLPKVKVMSLAEGGFIKARENVVMLGPTGTGKTHTVIALSMAAIQAGYRVRFIPAITLSQELLQAQAEARLPRYLKSWDKVDLAIIDELGYLGLGPGGPLLFQFCANRYDFSLTPS